MRTIERRQLGSQLVELALVLPLLLLLALLVAEGAGMVRTHQVLNNAAREGARLSSLQQNQLPGCTTGDADCPCGDDCVLALLTNAVKQYAKNNGLDDTKITVTVDQNCSVTIGGTDLTCTSGPTTLCSTCLGVSRVNVSYPYTFTFLPRLPGFSFATSITLSAQSVFRNLYT